ncbi:TPA: hypothetical protein N0F65_003613, partial [Lagenidium giganteum]
VRACSKVGEIWKTSRTALRVDDAVWQFDGRGQNSDLVVRAGQVIASAITSSSQRLQWVDRSIYLKPMHNAAQKAWIELTDDNFVDAVHSAKLNHEKRRKQTTPFKCDLGAFVRKSEQCTIRRATAQRIREAAAAIDEHIHDTPGHEAGAIARTHSFCSRAPTRRNAIRSPNDCHVSANAAFGQHEGKHGDRSRCPVGNACNYCAAQRLIKHGVAVNVRELRMILGLPNHDMLVQGIFHEFVPPTLRTEDINDVDHDDL